MMRLRHVAPAGAPIGAVDLARWGATSLTGGDVADALTDVIRKRFQVRHAFLASSGKAGLTMLLCALKRLAGTERDEVIVPSYTCYSVAAAVVKAGLRPRIVDVSPDTLDFAPEHLQRADFRRVLAIVACNLYGYPSDMAALTAVARQNGVFLIDDAAQAMGASVDGRPSGTCGDAGLFSLDKGKGISAVRGGVVVTGSDDIAAAIAAEANELESAEWPATGRDVMVGLLSSVLLRPSFYWIPNSIPQLGLGKTVYSTQFAVAHPSRALVALALVMVNRLNGFVDGRTANAAVLASGLRAVQGVRTFAPIGDAVSSYLRFPILVSDSRARNRILDDLAGAGIGASCSYPASIADLPELRNLLANPKAVADGGRYIATHILTLPTHTYVTPQDLARTVAIVGGDALEASIPMATPV
jgi:perosamine synthetase